MSAQVLFLFDSDDTGPDPISFHQEFEEETAPLSFEQEPGSNIDLLSFEEEPSTAQSRYDVPMNAPTREEFEAKLETIEARMDGRVASIQASIEASNIRMEHRHQSMDDRLVRVESSLKDTQGAISSLRTTMILTAISTVLAIAAFNATVLGNMLASFESGKNTIVSQADLKKAADETAVQQAELKRQSEQVEALLKQMRDHLPEASGSHPPPK